MIMADIDPNNPPADPTIPPKDTPPPTEDWKKKHDDAEAKRRILEKELNVAKTKIGTLEGTTQTANEQAVALNRTKAAYEAGLPSRLFPLVTGTTEAEIKEQVKLLLDEFGKQPAGDPPPVDPNAGGGGNPAPEIVVPPVKPVPAVGDQKMTIAKYSSLPLVERQKVDKQIADGKLKFSDM
jgi:hypothetical protein